VKQIMYDRSLRRRGRFFVFSYAMTLSGYDILISLAYVYWHTYTGLRILGGNAVAWNSAYCTLYIEHLCPVVIEPSLKTILKVQQYFPHLFRPQKV
jgi:hypothetical protein